MFKIPLSFHEILVGLEQNFPDWMIIESPMTIGECTIPEQIINQPSLINYIHIFPYIFMFKTICNEELIINQQTGVPSGKLTVCELENHHL